MDTVQQSRIETYVKPSMTMGCRGFDVRYSRQPAAIQHVSGRACFDGDTVGAHAPSSDNVGARVLRVAMHKFVAGKQREDKVVCSSKYSVWSTQFW